MAEVTKVVLTDLGTDAFHECDTVEITNQTLNDWCDSLAPNTARKFRAEIFTAQALPPTNNPALASKRETKPTLTLEFWLRREDRGTIDLEASIREQRFFDPSEFVFKGLFDLSKWGLKATIYDLLAKAPKGTAKQVAAYIKRVRDDWSEVVDEQLRSLK